MRRREVVLRNLSERKREGQKLLMADLKRMTEKTIDTGAGNKSDEKADQSENGKHAAGGKVTKRAAAERRVTEKTIDTGAGNKSDEKADQSENGKHAAGGKVAKRAAAERRVTEKAGKIR